MKKIAETAICAASKRVKARVRNRFSKALSTLKSSRRGEENIAGNAWAGWPQHPFIRIGQKYYWNQKKWRLDRSTAQSYLDLLEVVDRAPAFTDEAFLRHVEVEHVESVVDRFDLPHLDEPDLDVLGGSHQDAVTMVLRLTQNLSCVYRSHRVCRSLRLRLILRKV